EILALLGENGAGKSTLMNIIYGLYHQDEGQVFLKGKEVKFSSPREAIHSGIGMVHQHFQLVNVMTVAENVVLGEEKEAPHRRTLFAIFFALLFGIGVVWLSFQNDLIYNIFAFAVLAAGLPLVLARWLVRLASSGQNGSKRETLKRVRPIAAVVLQLLAALGVMLGAADGSGEIIGSLVVFAIGIAVGFGTAVILPPILADRLKPSESKTPLSWPLFALGALIVYAVCFLVSQSNTGDGLGAAGALLALFLGATVVAVGLAFVFDFLFNQWETVTGVLRVAWGAAWRLALIIVAFWVGNQMLRITEMGIITVILQHDVTFFSEAQEPVGNVNGKGGAAGTFENEISWRTIERAGSRQAQLNALLDEIDVTYGVEYTYENTHDGLTSRTFVKGQAGYNTFWHQLAEDVPPVARDIVTAGLLLAFVYLGIKTWRGHQFTPGWLTPFDWSVMAVIGVVYVWQLYVALKDVNPTTQVLLTIIGAVFIGMVFAWTVRDRQQHPNKERSTSALDGIIEAFVNLFYDAFSVRNAQTAGQRVRELSRQYGLEVDPDAVVEKLPVGAQQRVEIIKALYRKADILILDEPTAVLTPQEGRELFKIMRELASQGVSIIFITHKLKEVFEVASHIVVMRGGKVVGTTTPSEATESSLAAMMVGREVLLRVDKTEAKPRDVVLQAADLQAMDDRGAVALNGVSFEVREGEVLGIAGVQGNGQTELVEAITGLRPLLKGTVELLGQKLHSITPRHVKNMQTAHVPEDRLKYGMVKPFTVAENLILNDYYEAPYSEPPTPAQVPFLGAFYALIFGIVFAGLGFAWLSVWEDSLWYGILDRYDVPSAFRTVPSDRAMNAVEQGYLNTPLVIALLSLLITTLVFSIVAHLVASTIMRVLRHQAVQRELVQEKNGLVLNLDGTVQHAGNLIEQFDIRTPSPLVEGGSLSGGNQQKLVVAREFSRKPRLLIAAQPTRGIDVGSIEFIHKQIIAQRDEGAAVLLVSAELDEIMSLSDRIAVMYKGQIIETLEAKAATREQLGLLMAGIKRDEPIVAAETAMD
ncbi:MAG: ATP-binding cassette domain-containing protein, partial [Anaerolineae bacterium]